MDRFSSLHPITNLIYFIAVMLIAMTVRHPAVQAAGLLCALLYAVVFGRKQSSAFLIRGGIPIVLIFTLVNPLFNHEGATVLFTVPWGSDITLESTLYGLSSGVMTATVLSWCVAFNRCLPADRLISLFGRRLPSVSLLLSMTVRAVPKFRRTISDINDARKSFGKSVTDGNLTERMKNASRIFFAAVSRSLSDGAATADSIKSRGWGLENRTTYDSFRFTVRDFSLIAVMLILSGFCVVGAVNGEFSVEFYPEIILPKADIFSIISYVSVLLLGLIPSVYCTAEVLRWNASLSKI